MSTIESLMAKISVLQKKASALQDTQRKRVIAEMRKQIGLYDLQPAELFSNDPAAVDKPAPSTRITKSAKSTNSAKSPG